MPATDLAREHLGRPLPNAVLLGGFAALSGLISIDSVAAAIRQKFAGQIGERNVAAPRRRSSSCAPSAGRPAQCLGRRRAPRRSPRRSRCCRPEVICAYPISPQTHIVERLSDLVRTGELEPCEYVIGRVRVRGDVGRDRRLRGRRARLHRDREPGPALHGGGALQRLRPRPADRDDRGQPGDRRPDQHLERPQRRDVAARLRLDPALRRDQPGGRSTSTSRPSGSPSSSRCR